MKRGEQLPVIEEVREFAEDRQKLSSKFPTLEDDLERFKNVIMSQIKIMGLEPGQIHGAVRVDRLGANVTTPIFKFKHFRCAALRGKGCRSGIRVIYAYEKQGDKYTLVEIYYKEGDKQDLNRARILRHFGQS